MAQVDFQRRRSPWRKRYHQRESNGCNVGDQGCWNRNRYVLEEHVEIQSIETYIDRTCMQNHMDMYIYLIHGLGMYLIYLNYIHTSQSIDYVGGYKYESHAGWPQGADLRNHFGLVGHLPEATRMKKKCSSTWNAILGYHRPLYTHSRSYFQL